jgi:hypothetical protein
MSKNQRSSLLTMWGWFLLVKNERHFSGRAFYILCCVSASIGGIFLKLHILNSKPIPYKKFKFVCYWSIMKSALFRGHGILSALSWFPFEVFSCKCVPATQRGFPTKKW